ncbi:MAG: transcription antitermination factor NusB [Rhodobacteraceae bacterium]|nr:transcription antitermination factor NusB [Paracoccaceae bacterium]MBC66426.1 transcription antitermination factor NusB [Paracoccaceae bacterium]RZO35065.1 MAG: transcription antitermination factor NusB [Paracoccaceae bacterium]|tara:strand:- start:1761 stop:2207 length:447 start_codon:yes stop_codon:yes gene_type:complete
MKNTTLQMKSAARFYVVQALFQMEAINQDLNEIKEEFENFRIGAELDGIKYNDADKKYFRKILDVAVKNQSQIDKLTDQALVKKWPISKIDPTIRALFRGGVAELLLEKTPKNVVINEFVDIAKAFFPEGKETKFVNAILDHISKEVD